MINIRLFTHLYTSEFLLKQFKFQMDSMTSLCATVRFYRRTLNITFGIIHTELYILTKYFIVGSKTLHNDLTEH